MLSPQEVRQLDALLEESYRHHRVALEARLRQDGVTAQTELAIAQHLRLQALALDPKRRAAPWARERTKNFGGQDLHPALVAFYDTHVGAVVRAAQEQA